VHVFYKLALVPYKSVMAEHSIEAEHHITFKDSIALARTARCINCFMKEAIEDLSVS
jgi:hypothetical protein